MGLPNQIMAEVNKLITHLVRIGLANDQNFSILRALGANRTEVTFKSADYLSFELKNHSYTTIYDVLKKERAYTVLLPDGAMLQLNYQFLGDELAKHRLAFWPSPHLEHFQNDPDLYLEDSVYAEVVSRQVVPFPLRFDHDSSKQAFKEIRHPISHLTLGQYENCRIPLTAPLPPAHFADFVLRNFYNTAFHEFAGELSNMPNPYDDSISKNERNLIHLKIPEIIYKNSGALQS